MESAKVPVILLHHHLLHVYINYRGGTQCCVEDVAHAPSCVLRRHSRVFLLSPHLGGHVIAPLVLRSVSQVNDEWFQDEERVRSIVGLPDASQRTDPQAQAQAQAPGRGRESKVRIDACMPGWQCMLFCVVHTFMHRTNVGVRASVRLCVRVCVQAGVHACVHAFVHVCVRVFVHVCVRAAYLFPHFVGCVLESALLRAR